MPGTLFIVATPIGNLEDITLRALRVLREVNVIAAEDTRHTAKLLHHYEIRTPMTSFHEHNERQKLPVLMGRLTAGEDLALVSDAGTPGISDPGYRLVRAAVDGGIKVEPIPGPSAVIAALVGSGLPTDAFCFLGFPPIRAKARSAWMDTVASRPITTVFFESPHRVTATLKELATHLSPDRTVTVARELTKMHEQLVKGPIDHVLRVLGDSPKGEFTVVVSPHVAENSAVVGDLDRIPHEFGEMTNSSDISRRRAIRVLAKKHGLTPNEVYRRIEKSKVSW